MLYPLSYGRKSLISKTSARFSRRPPGTHRALDDIRSSPATTVAEARHRHDREHPDHQGQGAVTVSATHPTAPVGSRLSALV